ncbi:45 kDa antigen [Taenia solium]|eukprot:TsM_000203100 transcript=TsM_000203100 gene=TsM_000203100
MLHNARFTRTFLASAKWINADEDILQDLFRWDSVTSKSIRLRWDPPDQDEANNGEIEIRTVLISKPKFERSNSTHIDKGEVTLDGLMSNSSYKVTVTAMHNRIPFLKSSKIIQTLGTECLVYTGDEEGSVVGTSVSGVTSAIAGVLFTCIAVVHA